MENRFYWNIILYDGELIEVKPENIENVKSKLKQGEGFIVTATRSINVKNIKDFVESGEPYSDQKLLEEAASAFNEPVYTKDGIKCAWVKKSIPRREWVKTYSHIPAYKLLNDNDSHIEIAFVMAVHDINPHKVQRVMGSDLARLER